MTFDLTGITHITQDSRAARAGSLFVALTGEKMDGVQFIPQAEQNGAVAVLAATDTVLPPTHMRVIRAENVRLALAQIAAQFYPKQPAHMVAVTGTDGKTSTADFFRQLAHLAGYKSASIGTLGVYAGDGSKLYEGTHTTPGAIELHKMLQELAEAGYTHVCMEASSHGLDQYRMHGVRLTAAAFTNLARDHMDYHKTDEAYFAAKMKLFTEFELGTAVINVDDKRGQELSGMCTKNKVKVIAYGIRPEGWNGKCDEALLIDKRVVMPSGQKIVVFRIIFKRIFNFRIISKANSAKIILPLVGSFQAMNILAAMGLAEATGIQFKTLVSFVPKLQGVPGRLEHVATTKNGASVYVDYAHTPAALKNILETLRPHTQSKLHVVFGCGGNRDAGKRPEMGKVAETLADVVIVTDDNPRNEDPAAIRAAILAAAPRAKEVADRREAIYAAVRGLGAGDVLVIAGKGHEKTQTIGDKETPFDDAEVAKEATGGGMHG